MRHAHRRTIRHVIDEDGRRWPIPAGGSTDDPPPDDAGGVSDEDESVADDADPDDDEPLEKPGLKALATERDARKAAEKREKALVAELEQVKRSQMDDAERAQAEAVDAARAEVAATYVEKLTSAQARAIAAGLSHDPAAAVALFSAENDTNDFVTNGDVDADAMSAAFTTWIEGKPYLKTDAARAPIGGADQGRRTPPPPARATSLEGAVTAHYTTS